MVEVVSTGVSHMCDNSTVSVNKHINVLSVFQIHVSFLIQLQRGILFMYQGRSQDLEEGEAEYAKILG